MAKKSIPVPVPLDGWLTKGEVMKRTGLSDRTIDRKVEAGEIQMRQQTVPGRRPLPLYSPDDIERLIASSINSRPFIMPPDPGPSFSQQLVPMANNAVQEIGRVLSGVGDVRKNAFGGRTYLTIKEAVEFTGLPANVLLTAVKEGEIKGRKAGKWYLQRQSIEAF
jgi:hypothetical protein